MLLCSLKARLITFFKTLLIRFYLNSELMADSIYHKWPSPIAQSVACWTCSLGLFFQRIDDSHFDRILSSLTAVRCFDNGYVGKHPVAWKEYCADRTPERHG